MSFDNDEGSKLRNHLEAIFIRHGFQRSKTATWETDAISMATVFEFSRDFWDAVDTHAKNGGTGRLDHFWMYLDQEGPQPIFKF
jgi:hypothetical protein